MKFSCSLPKRETGSLHFFPLSSLRSSDLSSMENSHAFNQGTTSDGSDPITGGCCTRQQSEAGASSASSVSSPDALRRGQDKMPFSASPPIPRVDLLHIALDREPCFSSSSSASSPTVQRTDSLRKDYDTHGRALP